METTWTNDDQQRLNELCKILFAEDILRVFTKEEEQTDEYKEYASLVTKKQIHLLNRYSVIRSAERRVW